MIGLAGARAVDIFAGRIHGLRAPLRPLPVVLEGAAAPILRLVDLAMRVQPAERIVADRAHRDDLLVQIERQGIVDLDRRQFGIERQIARSPVVKPGQFVGLVASWHVPLGYSLRTEDEDAPARWSGGGDQPQHDGTGGTARTLLPAPRVRWACGAQ